MTPNRALSTGRRVFLALAALAVALFLLRPVCEAWFAHAGGAAPSHTVMLAAGGAGHSSVECCASIGDTGIAAPLPAAAGGLQTPAGWLVLAGLGAALLATRLAPRRPTRLAFAPTPQSYYQRSARILR